VAEQETLQGDVGEYRIFESIASGGFGSVFYGRDTSANVPVAVKRLHPHLKDHPGFVQRFEQEASTVRGLAHPNIVRMLDQGRDHLGVPFLVMEWVEGHTVGEWVKRRGLYPVGEAAEVMCQVLDGLQAAWARRIVHRDIKPANLMVTPGGRVKVMDFGVAKDVELATLGGASGVIGTPAYMAPEQLRGEPLDCRADLYALGATLYLMLVGRPPFEGPTMTDYFRQHLQDEPPPLGSSPRRRPGSSEPDGSAPGRGRDGRYRRLPRVRPIDPSGRANMPRCGVHIVSLTEEREAVSR
jgi:serine/threonine protein kinase